MFAYYSLGVYFSFHVLLAIFGVFNFKRVKWWDSAYCWVFIALPCVGFFVAIWDALLITPYRGVEFLFYVRTPLFLIFSFSSLAVFIFNKKSFLQVLLYVLHLLWGSLFPFLFLCLERSELFLFAPIVVGYWPIDELFFLTLIQVSYSLTQGVIGYCYIRERRITHNI